MKSILWRGLWLFLFAIVTVPLCAETWYIRPDGGTRYSAKRRTGQCDGKADAPYRGRGLNQHCAFNDVRYLWDDQSYGNDAWVIAGGDTVVIEGCAANSNERHPDPPHCRIGWDSNSGAGAGHTWCLGGNGNIGCSNPPIPAGTPERHTKILGGCAVHGTCNSGSETIRSNLSQLFGGFGVNSTLNLTNTQYVDVEGLEITSHNGQCIKHGSPAYPRGCNTGGSNLDDYSDNGIATNNATANVRLQDVYIHGFTTSGLQGPIGGPIKMTRVYVGFNGFAGWNFDDGRSTPDAPGSSITANYVTMEGNGCNEEYPITHTFPAMSCYDSDSGGFGDSWSGQDTKLDSFVCDHCIMAYNTKDGFIGPHTVVSYLKITNSESYGNMGQQWKWGAGQGSTTIFENNVTVGNCRRLSEPLPGAPPGYNRHLSNFCRAAGDVFSFYSAANGSVLFANNTIIGYSATMFDLACEIANSCGSTHYIFRNNIVLGFLNPKSDPAEPPGLFYFSDKSVKIDPDHDLFFNLRTKPCPWFGRPDLICENPGLVGEPPLRLSSEAQLDNFNFYPGRDSSVIGHGQTVEGITTDFFGVHRSSPPTIGAVEP